MKRAIIIMSLLAVLSTVFVSCSKKNEIVDYEGNSHTIVMEKGQPAQDSNGNLIEKYKNSDGEEVTQPISYPAVTSTGRKEIQNAYLKLELPKGWKYDDSIRKFRIQHDGECTNGGSVCEIDVETSNKNSVEKTYTNKIAIERGVELLGDDSVSDIKESTATLFGDINAKSFSSRHNKEITVYFYVFEYKGTTISIKIMVNDSCFNEDFNSEAFINDYFTLKDLG